MARFRADLSMVVFCLLSLLASVLGVLDEEVHGVLLVGSDRMNVKKSLWERHKPSLAIRLYEFLLRGVCKMI